MKKQHPNPEVVLPLSREIYKHLLSASIKSGYEKEDWEFGAIAIREWAMRNNPDSFGRPEIGGYQWKHLFLPNGTLCRTIYKGKNYHCLVDGDHLIYEGEQISPSRFVNTVGGVRRNAWDVIWILFPKSETWKRAASLRNGVF